MMTLHNDAKFYTARIGYGNPSKIVLDTTIKGKTDYDTGLGGVLAPTWGMVNNVKSGRISENIYTQEYAELMRSRYRHSRKYFQEIIGLARHPHFNGVVLTCYCSGSFCHRFIAVDIFQKICERNNIPFTYGGDIS